MSDNGESSRGVNLDEMTPDTVRLAGSGIVSAKDAAGMLGLNERTVRRAIARGDLLAVKRGRSFQITLESLAHFLQQRAAGAARGSSRSPPADPPGNEVKTIAGAPLG
nr:helix-turn-helix domain-containing protein [Chloroflexia bacterium]